MIYCDHFSAKGENYATLLLEAGCGSGERDEQDEWEVMQQRECGSWVRINTLGFTYSVFRIITALYLVYKCNLQLVLIHRNFFTLNYNRHGMR